MIGPKRILIGLSVAAALSLLQGSMAFAAPAGDEYLPKVPSATGHQSGGGNHGGSTAPTAAASSTPSATSMTDTQSTSTTEPSSGGSTKGKPKGKKDRKQKAAPSVLPAASIDNGSPGDDSSGLFDPIVLLIIAGVMVAAVGMTLRRRQGGDAPPAAREGQGGGTSGEAPNARPTPEGEIVAGGDKAL